jgi:hypothetical protein
VQRRGGWRQRCCRENVRENVRRARTLGGERVISLGPIVSDVLRRFVGLLLTRVSVTSLLPKRSARLTGSSGHAKGLESLRPWAGSTIRPSDMQLGGPCRGAGRVIPRPAPARTSERSTRPRCFCTLDTTPFATRLPPTAVVTPAGRSLRVHAAKPATITLMPQGQEFHPLSSNPNARYCELAFPAKDSTPLQLSRPRCSEVLPSDRAGRLAAFPSARLTMRPLTCRRRSPRAPPAGSLKVTRR